MFSKLCFKCNFVFITLLICAVVFLKVQKRFSNCSSWIDHFIWTLLTGSSNKQIYCHLVLCILMDYYFCAFCSN